MIQSNLFSSVILIVMRIIKQIIWTNRQLDVEKYVLLYDWTQGSVNKSVESRVGLVRNLYFLLLHLKAM